jgi:hypothetical protein
MSERGKRYRELLNEMEWYRATSTLPRSAELAFAGQLDRLWMQLTETEQEDIEKELEALDGATTAEESLGADTPEGSDEPREVAA